MSYVRAAFEDGRKTPDGPVLRYLLADSNRRSVPGIDQQIRRQDDRLGRILEIGVEQIELANSMQQDVSATLAWLSDKLYARARLESARIHQGSLEVADRR